MGSFERNGAPLYGPITGCCTEPIKLVVGMDNIHDRVEILNAAVHIPPPEPIVYGSDVFNAADCGMSDGLSSGGKILTKSSDPPDWPACFGAEFIRSGTYEWDL